MALRVIGIRHGEVHNPQGVIYSGLPGYVLSELGRSQATAVAEALRDVEVAAIYASPLDRATETASFIAKATGAEVRLDDRLHEWRHWAQWAGMTWEQLRTQGKDAFDLYMNDPGSVTSGESLAELADRMEAWLADVDRDHASESGIVIGVTHLEPLRAILLRMLDRPAKHLFQLEIGVGGVVSLSPDPDPEPIPLDDLAVRSSAAGGGT